jgi:hypothetical protein
LLVVGASSLVAAQPGDTPVAPLTDPYDAAFQALVDGNAEQAAAGFDAVGNSADPRAASAKELARLAHSLVSRHAHYSIQREPEAGAVSRKELDATDRDDGRTTFVATTTMFGLYAGVVIIDDANIDDERAAIGTLAITTGIGLLASYYGSKDAHMTGAMGDAYGVGMMFGAANGALLAHPAGADSSEQFQTTTLAAGAIGAIAGAAYARQAQPTRGQVSFASTTGILGVASTGLLIGALNPDLTDDQILTSLAAGADVGLGAGLAFGKSLDWSISRARIASLGMLLGGLTGAAAGALIVGDHPGDSGAQVISGATLAGLWAGFGIAAHSTRHMHPDLRYTPPKTTFTPMPVRGGAGVALSGQF